MKGGGVPFFDRRKLFSPKTHVFFHQQFYHTHSLLSIICTTDDHFFLETIVNVCWLLSKISFRLLLSPESGRHQFRAARPRAGLPRRGRRPAQPRAMPSSAPATRPSSDAELLSVIDSEIKYAEDCDEHDRVSEPTPLWVMYLSSELSVKSPRINPRFLSVKVQSH